MSAFGPAGTRVLRLPRTLVVESSVELGIASTAVLGGGLRRGRCIVSMQVPREYSGRDPAGDIRRHARAWGWEPDVGLMTAVPLDHVRLGVEHVDGVSAWAAVTAGVAHPCAAGALRPAYALAGTINVVALLDRALQPAAALNLIATITEAKVLELLAANVRTADGEAASGTVTDAVVVAWPLDGTPEPFGGPATAVGFAAARATREALAEALRA